MPGFVLPTSPQLETLAPSLLCALACILLASCGQRATVEFYAKNIASLIDPAKLATLSERGANPRVQKYVAQLAEAKRAGLSPDKVAAKAVTLAGMKGESAVLTAEAMVGNLMFADLLGCLEDEGLHDMRKGQSPTIRRGPYKGDELSVDHIIPIAVAPELDKVIANLELLPFKLNSSKKDRVGARQVDMARKFNKAGLPNDDRMKAVETAVNRPS